MMQIPIPTSLSAGEKAWRDMADDMATAARTPATDVDPYSPDSPDYAMRNREHETKLPNGILRIDYGAPAEPQR